MPNSDARLAFLRRRWYRRARRLESTGRETLLGFYCCAASVGLPGVGDCPAHGATLAPGGDLSAYYQALGAGHGLAVIGFHPRSDPAPPCAPLADSGEAVARG